MFEQLRSNDKPLENSSPEAEVVVVLVPDEVRATARLTSPEDPPPVKPFPAETAVISPLELVPVLSVEEIVILEPEVETVVAPEPVIVRAPVVVFKLETSASVDKLTRGF